MKEILLIGSYGAHNLGDEAILESLINITQEHHHTPIVVSAEPKKTSQTYLTKSIRPIPSGVRSFLKKGRHQTKKYFRSATCALLGGGGLFTDSEGRAVSIWARQALTLQKYQTPYYCIGQSVGPLSSKKARLLTQKVFTHARLINVRDTKSKRTLIELGIPSKKIIVGSDLALLHPPLPKTKPKKKKLLLNLRPWHNQEKKVIQTLLEVLPAKFEEVILLPMHPSDLPLLKELRLKLSLPHCSIHLLNPQTPREVLQTINECQLVLSMRLHPLILSSVQSTPAIGLSYLDKVKSFCLSSGTPSSNITSLNPKRLQQLIKKTTSPQTQKIEKLFQKTTQAVQKIFQDIESL